MEDAHERAIQKQMERDRAKGSRRIKKEVATKFQMIRRLESALELGEVPYIDKGQLKYKARGLGLCVCVTCGACDSYKRMDGGHYQSRDRPFTLLMMENVNVQCKRCNDKKILAGNLAMYRQWIDEVIDKQILITKLVEATQDNHEINIHFDSSSSVVLDRLSNLPSPHTSYTLARDRVVMSARIRELQKELE